MPAFVSMVFREAGNAEALEMAKRNLLEHYLIVGISEQMRQFIAVLENVLPKFFAGALTHFDSLTGMNVSCAFISATISM